MFPHKIQLWTYCSVWNPHISCNTSKKSFFGHLHSFLHSAAWTQLFAIWWCKVLVKKCWNMWTDVLDMYATCVRDSMPYAAELVLTQSVPARLVGTGSDVFPLMNEIQISPHPISYFHSPSLSFWSHPSFRIFFSNFPSLISAPSTSCFLWYPWKGEVSLRRGPFFLITLWCVCMLHHLWSFCCSLN